MKGREKSCLERDDLQSNIGQQPGVVLTHPTHERGEDLQIFGLLSVEEGERPQHEGEDALQGEGQQTPSLETGNELITFNVTTGNSASARTESTRSSSATSKERSKQFSRMVPSASQRLEHLINAEAPKREGVHVSATALIAYLTPVQIPAAIRAEAHSCSNPSAALNTSINAALRHPHDHVGAPGPPRRLTLSHFPPDSGLLSSHLRKRPHQKGTGMFHL